MANKLYESLISGSVDVPVTYTKYLLDENKNKTQEEINKSIDDKQDKLISGKNIKTINNISILGKGNIEIDFNLDDNSITTNKLADDSITTNKLTNQSVTSAKIASNAVQEEHIANGVIQETHFADNSVSTRTIQNKSITENKLADNAVNTNNILDSAITKNKIDDGQIFINHLNNYLLNEIFPNKNLIVNSGFIENGGWDYSGDINVDKDEIIIEGFASQYISLENGRYCLSFEHQEIENVNNTSIILEAGKFTIVRYSDSALFDNVTNNNGVLRLPFRTGLSIQKGFIVFDVVNGRYDFKITLESRYISIFKGLKLEKGEYSTKRQDFTTFEDINAIQKNKQDTLVSGENIATINGQSLLDGGNINISGGEGRGEIMLSGKLNLTSIDEIKSAQKTLSKTNEIAFYLVTDSVGNIPSTQSCYNISSDAVRQLSLTSPDVATNIVLNLLSINMQPIGVNVGDFIALTRVKVKVSDLIASIGVNIGLSGEIEIYQYKILSMNDAKPAGHNEANAGVMGLMSPWDKGQVNKISGIEATANNALPKNDILPSRWVNNMNDALQTGVYPWCDLGRPSGSTGHYTCIVNRTSTDDGSFNTIEQTAYGREAELGQVYKRIIFQHKNGNEIQYGEWINITSSGNSGSGEIIEHCIINSDTDKVLVQNSISNMSTIGVSSIVENVDLYTGYLCPSLYYAGAFVVFAFDYTYIVAKDNEDNFVIAEKQPTYSKRFATKEELFNKVDKPSRNLLINSNFDNGGIISNNSPWEYVALGSSSTLDSIILEHYNGYNAAQLQYLIYGQPVTLEVGKIYTLSCMYISDGTSNSYIDYNNLLGEKNIINGSNVQIDTSGIKLTPCNTYQKAYITFSVFQTSERILAIGNTDTSGHGGLFISCLQLEEGDMPTEYRRAEDSFATKTDVQIAIENAITKTLNTAV